MRSFRVVFEIIRRNEPEVVMTESRNLMAESLTAAVEIANRHAEIMGWPSGYCTYAALVGIYDLTAQAG